MSTLDYGKLLSQGLKLVIREALRHVERNGLPDGNHFLITFATNAEGVVLADRLRRLYPEAMTIVMQHWFDDLAVSDSGFTVTLSFDNRPEMLTVPFDAVTSFADPGARFGVSLDPLAIFALEPEQADDQKPAAEPDDAGRPQVQPVQFDDGKVLSIDKFRKTST